MSFEDIKDSVICKVVNTDNNKDKLEGKPQEKIEDMTIMFATVIAQKEGERLTLPITNEMMNDMGIEISGYRYDKESDQFLLQRVVGNKEYDIPFINESDGTRKLFAALPVIILALREGRLIIIDELDAKLHPKLLRYVIKLFTNPEINRNGAQLLFTSHDLTTMKNTVFRRDEIWFAALNDENISEIFSLYDIRREDNEHVNNTAAYDKQYLEGRYGADPYLRNMLSWEALDEQKAT